MAVGIITLTKPPAWIDFGSILVRALYTLIHYSLLILAFSLAACTTKEEAAEEFYQRGLAYFEKNELEKSRVEFLNVIQRNPQFSQAYYHLGLLAQHGGEVAIVFEMMSKSLKLDPRNLEAKKTLAQLLVLGRKFDNALSMADEIVGSHPQDFDGYRIRAAALIGLKKLTQAERSINRAEEINGEDVSLFGLRAILARERGDAQSALLFLGKAIATGRDKKQYLILRSKIYRDQQNNSALIDDLYSLVEVDPGESQFVYALAKILVRLKQPDQAEKVLAKFVAAQPDNFTAKQLLIDTIYLIDKTRSNQLLERLIAEFPQATEFKFYKIRLLLKKGETATAKQQLKQLGRVPNAEKTHLKAKALLAEVLLSEGERDAALALIFENFEENNQHEESHLVKAKYDLDNKDYDLAIGSLHTVLGNNPTSETGLVLLGTIYIESGSDLLADDSFRQVLQLNPANAEAAMPVVEKLIQSQDLERADKIIARVLDSRPSDAKLLMFYIQIKLLRRDWPGARYAVERLESLGRAQAYVAFLRGRIAQGEGDCDSAVPYYRDALAAKPKILPALEGLVTCYLFASKESALLEYLQSYKRQNPTLVYGYSAAAQVHQLNRRFALATKELEAALRLQPDWLKGYANLAGLKNGLKDTDGAIAAFKRGIEQKPQDEYLKVLLAAYYESLGLSDKAAALYEEIVADHPDSLVAFNNYAVLLMEKLPSTENYQRALSLAQRFRLSEQPMFLDTYGWALVKTENLIAGEAVLRNAVEKAPLFAEIRYHLALSLKQLGRIEEARLVVRRAQRLSNVSPEMLAILDDELSALEQMRENKDKNW